MRLKMNKQEYNEIYETLTSFMLWLERYGELSYDQYDFWASRFGQKAKSLYYSNKRVGIFFVAPFVLMDSFAPSMRKLFSSKSRFPIADAHYCMGFLYLYSLTGDSRYTKIAKHFLDVLIESKCEGRKHFSWGYPFSWATVSGIFSKGTPLITTTPYVYEAFSHYTDLTGDHSYDDILLSICEHAVHDIKDFVINSDVSACSYSPFDKRKVVNANAYRAFMLFHASDKFKNDNYRDIAGRNLRFVLESQQNDGSWLYAMDGDDKFTDNFHTCFVMKNIVKIANITGSEACYDALDKGVNFYLDNLLDDNLLPKPFAVAPRTILYRRELYDYAECINLAVLLKDRYPRFNDVLINLMRDLQLRWKKKDGSFRTRQLLLGWNNVPYHRWAQSQLFRSLAEYIYHENNNIKKAV